MAWGKRFWIIFLYALVMLGAFALTLTLATLLTVVIGIGLVWLYPQHWMVEWFHDYFLTALVFILLAC